MNPICSKRLAVYSGLVFVILSLVIVAMVPPLPSLDKTVAEVANYYTTFGQRFLIGNYIATFAAVPSFVFFSYLILQIKKREAGGWLWIAALSTTVIAHAVGGVDLILFQLAAHLGTHGLAGGQIASPETIKIASDFACLGFGFFFIFQAAFAAYLSWAIFKTQFLRPIHVWLGIATAISSFFASLGTVQTTGVLTIGGPITSMAFLIFFIWIVGMSLALWRVEEI